MKLMSCHIENFGAVSNSDFKFGENFTGIIRENGKGKTTLAAFLRAMLYGLPTVKKNGKEFSDRLHYCPFSGGRFGGSLTCLIDGKEFRIERFFDSRSETKDTFQVFCGADEVSEKEKYTGEALFGLDRDSFERLATMSSEDISPETTPEIRMKLSAESDGITDPGSILKAIERISKAYREIRTDKGDRGILREKQRKAQELENEITNLKKIEAGIAERYDARKAILAEKEEKTEREKNAARLRALIDSGKIYRKITERAQEAEAEVDSLKAKYPGGIPDGESGKFILQKVREIEKSAEIIENCRPLPGHSERYSELKALLESGKNRPGILFYIFAVIALAIIGTGVFAAVKAGAFGSEKTGTMYGTVLLASGLVLILTAVFILLRKRSLHKSLLAEYCSLESEMNEIYEKTSLEERKTEKAGNELKNALGAFGIKTSEPDEIRALLHDMTVDRTRITALTENACKARKEASEYADSHEMIENPESEDIIPEDPAILRADIVELTAKLRNLDFEIENMENDASRIPVKENALTVLKQEISELSGQYRILVETEKCLRTSLENIQKRYIDPVRTGFENNMALVCGSIPEKYAMDREYNIYYERNGSLRSEAHLSTGQRAIETLCKKYALLEAVYTGPEKPFIILDDPFVFLDEENMSKISEALPVLSEKFQTLYFSCHESRRIPDSFPDELQ